MSKRRPTGAPRRGPSLSRRAFLGGAGTLLALPLFESVTPTLARASTATQASPSSSRMTGPGKHSRETAPAKTSRTSSMFRSSWERESRPRLSCTRA